MHGVRKSGNAQETKKAWTLVETCIKTTMLLTRLEEGLQTHLLLHLHAVIV